MGAGPGVDEIDAGQIPSGDAHGGANERAVRGRELVADAFDGEGPVAFALCARDLRAERAAERVTRRARAADAGPREATLDRSLLDLAVEAAVVLEAAHTRPSARSGGNWRTDGIHSLARSSW